MPEWIYEFLEGFVLFMDSIKLRDALAIMATSSILMPPFVVLVHEAGHALAAVALRHRVTELRVGDDEPWLTVRAGHFRFRLGAIVGDGDVGGFVLYDDGGRASPRATLTISLAGPVASLAGALVTGFAAVWAWPHVIVSVWLGLATAGGLICCVANLRVSGDGPQSWSDGVWVRAAWHAMHTPPPPPSAATVPDRREATSVPPPGR